MNRAFRKILFILMLAVPAFYLSCERVEPDIVSGEADGYVTELHPGLQLLDPEQFQFLGVLDDRYIFDTDASSVFPAAGSIIYYNDENRCILGRIETISNEEGLIRIGLTEVSLNDIFNYLSFRCNIDELETKTIYIHPEAVAESDTLIFEPLEFFWDLSEGVWGILNIDSLKVYNEPDGNMNIFMGPIWDGGTGTKKIDFSFNQEYYLGGSINIINKGEYTSIDSLKIRERSAGPFYAGDVPVYFMVEEWLKIDIRSEGDNNIHLSAGMRDRLEITSGYLMGKNWNNTATISGQNSRLDSVGWGKESSADISVSLMTSVIPVFCGNAGLEHRSELSFHLDGYTEWPDWGFDLYRESSQNMMLTEGFFDDMPEAGISFDPTQLLIYTESGQLQNTAPVAQFTIDPASGYTDTDFSFDASNSYDEEDDSETLEVRWDFDGDEVWDTSFSTDKTADHIFPVPANYIVILEVRDSQGKVTPTAKILTVQERSSAPIAHFTVTPENGRTSDIFTFDASGCWDSEDPVNLLKVRWDFEGDDVWDTEYSTVKAIIHPYRTPGTYYPQVQVLDKQGLTNSTSRKIEVEAANIKPTAIFTVTPEEGTIETTFRFDASGCTDPEDDSELLEVRWDFENDGIWDTQYRTIKTINHIYPVADTYRAVLEVMDTDGFSNTFSKDILVSNPNTPPTADFNIDPARGDTTTVFTFDARSSSDLEDSLDQLQFRWDWDNDDVYDTEFSFNPIIQKQFTAIGTYIIKLQVKDSGGLIDPKARLLIVE